jgi:hypothetical protein
VPEMWTQSLAQRLFVCRYAMLVCQVPSKKSKSWPGDALAWVGLAADATARARARPRSFGCMVTIILGLLI